MKIENRYLVYLHKDKNNNVFYVGIGTKYRPRSTQNRNRFWHNHVKKHGFPEIEIIISDITREEAMKKEVELIKKYGRRDLKTGCLINLTDGGKGVKNSTYDMSGKNNPMYGRRIFWDEARREKMKIIRGNCPAWGKHINKRTKVSRPKGFKVSQSQKDKLSAWHKANPWKCEQRSKLSKDQKGENHPNCKPIINLETGIFYFGIREASESIGMKITTLKNQIYGGCGNSNRINHTSLKYTD